MRLTPKRLFALLGRERAIALMSEWGGHSLPHWTEDDARRLVRDDEIRADLDRGATYRGVAQDRDLSVRMIVKIASERAE